MPLPNIIEFIGTNITQRKFQQAQEKLLNYLGVEVPTKTELNSEISKLNNAITPKADKIYVDSALSSFQNGALKTYPTLAEANADIANIALNTKVSVLSVENGGDYYKATAGATTLTKSAFDPVMQSKEYADQKSSAAVVTATNNLGGYSEVYVDLVDRNATDFLKDFCINHINGTVAALSGWNTSAYIPVVAGDIIQFAHIGIYGSFYDSSFTRIAFTWALDVTSQTAPVGAAFVRISYRYATMNGENFWAVKSTNPVNGHYVYPYNKTISPSHIPQLSSRSIPTITPDKLAVFNKSGTNLFNFNTAKNGYFVDQNGAETAHAAYAASDYIEVVAGSTYTASAAMRFVTMYSQNYNARSDVSITTAGTLQFTIPDGITHIRVTLNSSALNTFALAVGSTTPTYSAYKWVAATTLPDGTPIEYPTPSIPVYIEPRPAYYGLANLRETRKRLRALRHGATGAGSMLTIAMIGDSWTHNNGRYAYKVAQVLWRKYQSSASNVEHGPSGLGLISFGGVGGSLPNGAITWNAMAKVASGSVDISAYGTGGGPDICQAVMQSDSVVRLDGGITTNRGISYTLMFEGGAGSVQWSFDDGATWSNVLDLTTFPTGLQTYEIDVSAWSGVASKPFRIKAVTQSTIYGINSVLKNTAGIVVHKLGATGTRAQQWATVDATRWKAGMAALAPNLVTIMHGTNDQTIGRTKAQFKADVKTIIDRAISVNPSADILLLSPAENQRTKNPIAMSQYADAMWELAKENSYAYADMQPHFGVNPSEYAFGSSRPWFASDLIHPDPETGGYALTDAVLYALGEHGA